MADRAVVIAANGDNARWGSPGLKVLAPVDGVPLITRTVSMVRERGADPLVLSQHEQVANIGRPVVTPPTGSVCETLATTAYRWPREDAVVLLGDVWYTAATMDAVLDLRGPCHAWGDAEEVYAVAWGWGFWPVVAGALDTAIQHGGKLWHLLRVLDGLDPGSHAVLPSMLTMVDDGTRDFDVAVDFRRWRRQRCQTSR